MAATEKISVTIGRRELGHAKQLASRLGISLSGFITDAVRDRVREQQRREAARQVLKSFAPEDRASPAEAAALLEHWAAPPSPAPKRPRRRTAAAKLRRKG
jgi:hypothetical protein